MNVVVMPYGIKFEEDGHIATFPAAFVQFEKKNNGESVQAIVLVDSGATVTTLPSSDADALGFTVERGERTVVRGYGSELIGFRHEATCTIGDKLLQLPVVFVNHPAVPRILGRAGIFDRFTIVFEEIKHRTGFIGRTSKEAKTVTKLLDV